MRMKKLFAGVLAGAMVVGCMVVPSSAAVTYTSEVTSVTGTFTWDVSDGWFVSTDTWATVALQNWSTGTIDVDGAYATLDDGSTVDLTVNFENDTYTVVIIGGTEISDYTEVASVTYEVTYDADEFFDDEAWIGGCIAISAASNGWWTAKEFGKASGDKELDIEDTAVFSETLAIEISEDDLSANSYVVTLLDAEIGETAEVNGNTYYVEDGKYYIGIDVSDIPVNETVTVDAVDFY